MSERHNIPTAAGTTGNTVVPPDLFGWPLPDRLGVLCLPGVANVAMWDADNPDKAKLPDEITQSSGVQIYIKLSESKLDSNLPGVVRGAEYGLEEIEIPEYTIQLYPQVAGCRCNVINVTTTGDLTRQYRRYLTPDCSLHKGKSS